MTRSILTILALAAATASAQQNLLFNGDFETIDGFTGEPAGWGLFNSARFREDGDGLGEILIRSGTHSLELASGADFVGATTNVWNPDELEYYDPKYIWRGGPCKITGYYAIPAGQPLDGAVSGLKLEFRRENSSVYLGVEDLSIEGDTNGEWVEFGFTVGCGQLPADWPPFPVAVSVLPIRFGDANSTGTIFWDDLHFTQCIADMNCDDLVNTQDFIAYLNLWVAQDPRADFNGDGIVNTQDFLVYLNVWAQPCP
jgi:hypothetical protein